MLPFLNKNFIPEVLLLQEFSLVQLKTRSLSQNHKKIRLTDNLKGKKNEIYWTKRKKKGNSDTPQSQNPASTLPASQMESQVPHPGTGEASLLPTAKDMNFPCLHPVCIPPNVQAVRGSAREPVLLGCLIILFTSNLAKIPRP